MCRISGFFDPIGAEWWGVNANVLRLGARRRATALAEARALGVKSVRDDFTSWSQLDANPAGTASLWQEYRRHGIEVTGILCYGLDRYSSRSTDAGKHGQPRTGDKYPPRDLWTDAGQPSPWAVYVDSVMRLLPAVIDWEVWNEPNVRGVYFGDPDFRYYGGSEPAEPNPVDTPRERCSLYVRMCFLAESVATTLGGRRRIIAGSVARVLENVPAEGLSPGVEWIEDMLDIADRHYGGTENCFDVVSVHPYQHVGTPPAHPHAVFSAMRFEQELDTLRAIMASAGHGSMPLWVTELGWNLYYWGDASGHAGYRLSRGATPERNASNLAKFYVSAVASSARPGGGYSRVFWYELTSSRDVGLHNEGFGLLDSTPGQNRTPAAHAYRQVIACLTGSRFRRRMDEGRPPDGHIQVYEFEDGDGRGLWAGWSDGSLPARTETVRIPVRTDRVLLDSLAYGEVTPSQSRRSGDDGWFVTTLPERPMFIRELGDPSRPDLAVDRVWLDPPEPVAGKGLVLHALVSNAGSRATPRGYRTAVRFCVEGESIGTVQRAVPIGAGETAEFRFGVPRVPVSLPGPALWSVEVNPGQLFVELDTTNNTGYAYSEGR